MIRYCAHCHSVTEWSAWPLSLGGYYTPGEGWRGWTVTQWRCPTRGCTNTYTVETITEPQSTLVIRERMVAAPQTFWPRYTRMGQFPPAYSPLHHERKALS